MMGITTLQPGTVAYRRANVALALTLIPASLLADRHGRSRMMKGSLVLAALCALLLPLANTFPQLVILRGQWPALVALLTVLLLCLLGVVSRLRHR